MSGDADEAATASEAKKDNLVDQLPVSQQEADNQVSQIKKLVDDSNISLQRELSWWTGHVETLEAVQVTFHWFSGDTNIPNPFRNWQSRVTHAEDIVEVPVIGLTGGDFLAILDVYEQKISKIVNRFLESLGEDVQTYIGISSGERGCRYKDHGRGTDQVVHGSSWK